MRRLPLLGLLLALTLAACGGDDDGDDDAGGTTTTAGRATTEADGTTTSAAATTAAPPTSGAPTTAAPTTAAATTTTPEDGDTDLADGRHPAFLTAIDAAARTLEFDKVQFLTGDEAQAAWAEDHPEETGPPNDYYIVNDNPLLRTLPVADDVAVTLVRLAEDSDADLDPGTWEELPAYLAASPDPEGTSLSYSPYWLTVTGGTITGIEEQYIP